MSIKDIASTAGEKIAVQRHFSLKTLWIGLGFLLGLVLLLRIYEQIFGWNAGLDSFAPEFQIIWGNLLIVAVPAAFLGAIGIAGYMWRTRDRHLDDITPIEETRRYFVLVQWLVIFALALYFGLSFFTEQTAVWHMTAVRDTDFTPSNIVTFYVAYPLFTIQMCIRDRPQCSGPAKPSSIHQEVWPHSLKPTLGIVMNVPTTKIRKGSE